MHTILNKHKYAWTAWRNDSRSGLHTNSIGFCRNGNAQAHSGHCSVVDLWHPPEVAMPFGGLNSWLMIFPFATNDNDIGSGKLNGTALEIILRCQNRNIVRGPHQHRMCQWKNCCDTSAALVQNLCYGSLHSHTTSRDTSPSSYGPFHTPHDTTRRQVQTTIRVNNIISQLRTPRALLTSEKMSAMYYDCHGWCRCHRSLLSNSFCIHRIGVQRMLSLFNIQYDNARMYHAPAPLRCMMGHKRTMLYTFVFLSMPSLFTISCLMCAWMCVCLCVLVLMRVQRNDSSQAPTEIDISHFVESIVVGFFIHKTIHVSQSELARADIPWAFVFETSTWCRHQVV